MTKANKTRLEAQRLKAEKALAKARKETQKLKQAEAKLYEGIGRKAVDLFKGFASTEDKDFKKASDEFMAYLTKALD